MEQHLNEANIPPDYARIIGRELGMTLRDLPKLLEYTGVSVDDFMRDDTLLSAQQFIQILQNSLKLANDVAFGLKFGKNLTLTAHGLMGFLIHNSPNLKVALQAFKNFVPTRISFAEVTLKETENSIVCALRFDFPLSTDTHRMLSETCTLAVCDAAEIITGRRLDQAVISFMHPRPDYHAAYTNYFSAHCHFSAPSLQIEIPKDICEIPNALANHHNYQLAMQQCELLLNDLKPSQKKYSYQIQKIMLSHPLSELSEENIAARLFITKRTLARKLANEGTSFRQLTDSIKSKQAISYLCEKNLTVEVIANLLNYHDSASFRRAFKRWFKMTPTDYKEKFKSEAQCAIFEVNNPSSEA